MSEADVQRWVKNEILKSYPDAYIFKVQVGQYASRKGIPDWVACIKGKFIGIEVKTDVGKLSKLQAHELSKIRAAGGLSYTIYGKDDKMIKLIMMEIENEI